MPWACSCYGAFTAPGFSRIAPWVPLRVYLENRMGGFRKGGSCNTRFVLKPDVQIASEVSIFCKNSLATTDFLAKKRS